MSNANLIPLHFAGPDAYALGHGAQLPALDIGQVWDLISIVKRFYGLDITSPDGLTVALQTLLEVLDKLGVSKLVDLAREALNDDENFKILLAVVRWVAAKAGIKTGVTYGYEAGTFWINPEIFAKWLEIAQMIVQAVLSARR